MSAHTSQLPIHLHASNNSFLSSLSCRFENCPTPAWHSFGHYFNKSLISSVGALTVPSTRQTQFVYSSNFLFKKLFVLFSRGINLGNVFAAKNLQIFIPLLMADVQLLSQHILKTWTEIHVISSIFVFHFNTSLTRSAASILVIKIFSIYIRVLLRFMDSSNGWGGVSQQQANKSSQSASDSPAI